jgi:spermidine synthase
LAIALYLLFFLSGAASLVYEVAWSRSLGLVFGSSHLAVTTVLAIFMGGLALGSALLGGHADRARRPLRLYGLLELGVAACAVCFVVLLEIYPTVYAPLARIAEGSRAWVTAVRVALCAIAMLPATILMGGTLPVLTRFVTSGPERFARKVSLLYAINTIGAVTGTFASGFVLLRTLGVGVTLGVAVATNVAVGVAALLLPARWFAAHGDAAVASPAGAEAPATPVRVGRTEQAEGSPGAIPVRLVLFGAAVSGFCALGYEVLWTRMFALVIGTSVYGFTLVLVSFLAGIAIGSHVFGAVRRWDSADASGQLLAFGLVEIGIGIAALAVTLQMRDLPAHVANVQAIVVGPGAGFAMRQTAVFVAAAVFFFVPAFLMGAAFPLAATLVSTRRPAGGAVGATYAWNTFGSILGASVTGFVLVPAVGIERSLQLLATLNVGVGCAIGAIASRRRLGPWAVAAATAAVLVALAAAPDWGRFWDRNYFAIYQNNRRKAYVDAKSRRALLEATEVLYRFEGVNETISVTRRDGNQSFVVNARVEASTGGGDMQFQRALGHLPVLLHPDPKRVFVLGAGAGVTLGSATIHPEVERVVLAEIEPGVLPATRLFGTWNHDAVDSPKLRIVLNDGRNYLATTEERFDVITADPIHPWAGGAAYLYTSEYFASVARHLNPGGVAGQWLPLYELSPADVKSVIATFALHFRHVLAFVTMSDCVLIGSDTPFLIDEGALARRLARPEIARDLREVEMGSVEDLLSYFVFGTSGAAAYTRGAVVNTDNNLNLEFSAPRSIGNRAASGKNILELARHRETLVPYLVPASTADGRAAQLRRWGRNEQAARVWDEAHGLLVLGATDDARLGQLVMLMRAEFPEYAPLRFLRHLQ